MKITKKWLSTFILLLIVWLLGLAMLVTNYAAVMDLNILPPKILVYTDTIALLAIGLALWLGGIFGKHAKKFGIYAGVIALAFAVVPFMILRMKLLYLGGVILFTMFTAGMVIAVARRDLRFDD